LSFLNNLVSSGTLLESSNPSPFLVNMFRWLEVLFSLIYYDVVRTRITSKTFIRVSHWTKFSYMLETCSGQQSLFFSFKIEEDWLVHEINADYRIISREVGIFVHNTSSALLEPINDLSNSQKDSRNSCIY
jgi:hypothetical protein